MRQGANHQCGWISQSEPQATAPLLDSTDAFVPLPHAKAASGQPPKLKQLIDVDDQKDVGNEKEEAEPFVFPGGKRGQPLRADQRGKPHGNSRDQRHAAGETELHRKPSRV